MISAGCVVYGREQEATGVTNIRADRRREGEEGDKEQDF
jgi:hypothetical protein